MKNRKKTTSLFSLLAANYLLFTAALLTITAILYLSWLWRTDLLLRIPDIDGLISDEAFLQGRYEEIPIKKYLNKDDSIMVLDEKNSLIYTSDVSFTGSYTQGELACIPEYTDEDYIYSWEYLTQEGERQYFVLASNYSNGMILTADRFMVLDEEYRVVSGGFDKRKKSYTQNEFHILTGNMVKGHTELYRHSYVDNKKNKRVLVIHIDTREEENYHKFIEITRQSGMTFIPIYIIVTALFILWLNHKIHKPLKSLDQAISSLAEGKSEYAGDFCGPREIKEIGESFNHLVEKLTASEAERNRLDEGRQKLIADISHDLKTPVTVIQGYARAILDKKISPEQMEQYLSAIEIKSSTLAELINSFHEYSKINHPEFSLTLEEVDICEFSREYLAGKYDEIELAGFSLELDIPEYTLYCRLDTFQMGRALDNILSNSLRYNTLGTIIFYTIKLDKSMATIWIGDNGIGIPSGMKESIFEPFTMVDESRSAGGSGLGLSITKLIIKEHGGRIGLKIPPDKGFSTEFIVSLPLAGRNAFSDIL